MKYAGPGGPAESELRESAGCYHAEARRLGAGRCYSAAAAAAVLAEARAGEMDASRNFVGFCAAPRKRTSKCRCGPVERPVDPTSAILRPRATTSPSLTKSFEQCA